MLIERRTTVSSPLFRFLLSSGTNQFFLANNFAICFPFVSNLHVYYSELRRAEQSTPFPHLLCSNSVWNRRKKGGWTRLHQVIAADPALLPVLSFNRYQSYLAMEISFLLYACLSSRSCKSTAGCTCVDEMLISRQLRVSRYPLFIYASNCKSRHKLLCSDLSVTYFIQTLDRSILFSDADSNFLIHRGASKILQQQAGGLAVRIARRV